MSPEREFRLARPTDAGGIVSTVRSGFEDSILEAVIYGCHGVEMYVRLLIEASTRGGDTSYTVALVDGELGGCVELRNRRDAVIVNYISVLPHLRSCGLGSSLLSPLVRQFALGTQQVMFLDVFNSNHVARAWYEKFGFRSERLTEWWSVPLADFRKERKGWARIEGYPQAYVGMKNFGFGQFCVATDQGEYQVRLLGKKYFRVTEAAPLSDPALTPILQGIDKHRSILALLPQGSLPGELRECSTALATTTRLRLER